MIILAVQGSGKSYAASTRDDVADIDRIRGKENLDDYIGRLLNASDNYKYVLGNLRKDIAEELGRRGISFTLFAPFRGSLSPQEYQEMKERIFGRLVLRKEQNAYTCKYIETFKAGYDTWNSEDYYSDLSGNESYFCMDRKYDTVAKLIDLYEERGKNDLI